MSQTHVLPDGTTLVLPDDTTPDEAAKLVNQRAQTAQPEDSTFTRILKAGYRMLGSMTGEDPGVTAGTPLPGPQPFTTAPLQQAAIPTALAAGGGYAGYRMAGTPGAMVLAGTGAALGREINAKIGLGPEPTGSDLLTTGLVTGLTEGGSRLALNAVGAGATGMFAQAPKPSAAEILAAERTLGVEPKLTDVTASRLPAVLERATAQTLPGQGPINARLAASNERVVTAADDFVSGLGPRLGRLQSGEEVAAGLRAQYKAARATEDRLYDALPSMARGVEVTGGQTLGAARSFLAEQQALPSSRRNRALTDVANDIVKTFEPGQDLAQFLNSHPMVQKQLGITTVPPEGTPVRAFLQRLYDESGTPPAPTTISWKEARVWQKDFGAEAKGSELVKAVQGQGVGSAAASRLFAAISTDMETAAANANNPQLTAALREARDFTTRVNEIYKDSGVAQVLKKKNPEDVIRSLGAESGPTQVKNIREAILGIGVDPANAAPADLRRWQLVQRHVGEALLQAEPVRRVVPGIDAEVVSGNMLAKRMNRIGEDTLNELFSPAQKAMLDNVAIVAKAIQSSERVSAQGYTSTTAGALSAHSMMALPGTLAGSAAGYFAGHAIGLGPVTGAAVGGAVGSAVSSFLTPLALSRALLNPRAAEIMAGPGFRHIADDIRLGGVMSREATIALAGLTAVMATAPSPARGGPRAE